MQSVFASTLCLKKTTLTRHAITLMSIKQFRKFFGRTVAKRVTYQIMIYFPNSPNWCLCTTWGTKNPRNCMFSLTHCILLYQQTWKHVQIITWLQLNHDSLLIRYLCNSVKCYPLSNTPWILFFLSATQRISAHGACNPVSCCNAKHHFFDSYGPSSPETNSNNYITRFIESYSIINMGCNLQVSNIEEIKQQVAQLRKTIDTAFERHNFCISVFVFPQVEYRHYVRWKNKSSFDSVVSPQRLCQ